MLPVRVVKLGGNEFDRPAWLAACAAALKVVEPVVVVHGGGQAVSALSLRLGLRVEKREGRRITPPDVAEVVEMVLAGPTNRSVVAALRRAGIDAIGLAGVDGGLLTARPVVGGGDGGLGHVGEIAPLRAPHTPGPPAPRPPPAPPARSASEALLGVYARVGPVFVRGEGAELVAEDGARYLDFVAGIGVNALGYNHPVIRAAVDRALSTGLIHVSNLYRTEP